MKRILFVCLLFCGLTVLGQEKSAFLPLNLGTEVNSVYDELNPVISPDGKKIFFVRSNHPENTYGSFDSQDIWTSDWQDGKWSTARRIKELNIGRYNAVLSVSNDGKTVLINRVYNKKGTFW